MKNTSAAVASARLKKAGIPVLPGGNWSRGSLIEISAETGATAPDGLPWADYYLGHGVFGVHEDLDAMLSKMGLVAEWINPGVLGVYRA